MQGKGLGAFQDIDQLTMFAVSLERQRVCLQQDGNSKLASLGIEPQQCCLSSPADVDADDHCWARAVAMH